MGLKRARIAECRAIQKRVICELEAALGVEAALPVTMEVLRVIAAMERLDNKIVESA